MGNGHLCTAQTGGQTGVPRLGSCAASALASATAVGCQSVHARSLFVEGKLEYSPSSGCGSQRMNNALGAARMVMDTMRACSNIAANRKWDEHMGRNCVDMYRVFRQAADILLQVAHRSARP
jgi:hypothetical protein